MRKLWKEEKGEGYIDIAVLVLCVFLVLALSVKLLPVFIAKQQLDTYATELCREAEISGRVGSETSRRAAVLTEQTGLTPEIQWSKSGRIQLNEGSLGGCAGRKSGAGIPRIFRPADGAVRREGQPAGCVFCHAGRVLQRGGL